MWLTDPVFISVLSVRVGGDSTICSACSSSELICCCCFIISSDSGVSTVSVSSVFSGLCCLRQ